MIALSAEEAGFALGRGALAAPVKRVCTDSRRLKPGDLFVALRGENFNGHDFVAEALAKGASGAIVDADWWMARATLSGFAAGRGTGIEDQADNIYPVDDTLRALGLLASEVRRKSGVKVVAITGSVGKTSTKDLLGTMAARVCRVIVTPANQNNEVGVPLTLLEIEPSTELAVVEMGMRGQGQIEALAQVAEPDVGLITNVHPVHLELLGSLENIAKAKAELLAGLGATGVAVIPAESELLARYAAAVTCKVVKFALGPPGGGAASAAEVRGSFRPGQDERAGVLHLLWPEGQAEVEVPFASRHRLENAVAAAAACNAAGLAMEQCVAGLADARFSRSRGDVIRLNGITLIDDTYNASPAAVRAALDDLVDLASEEGGRPVAVLGDMLELGPDAVVYHEAAGSYAAEAGVAAVWGVGDLSVSTVEGFRRARGLLAAGRSDKRFLLVQAGNVRSADEGSPVLANLRRGDVVLLKASRSLGLEALVRRITQEAAAGRWAPSSGANTSTGGATKGSEA